MHLLKNKRLVLFIILLIFSVFSSYLILTTSQIFNSDKHLVLLAEQFTKKHIALLPDKYLPLGDISDYYSNFYLYFGPLPSIILMPFVLIFGKNTPQVILGILSMIISFFTIFSISKYFNFKKLDSLWLSLFFVFSTVLFSASLINISAYQVEVIGVPLILLSLWAYFSKKNPIWIGVFIALAVLARPTLILAFVFFLFEFIQRRINAKQVLLILFPIIIACLVFGLYNQRRFHSFFETGYKYSISLKTYPLFLNLRYGYMSPVHIPANLYSFLIMPPEPLIIHENGLTLKFPYLKANPWGMAIWYTSPLFLALLYKFKRGKYILSSVATAFIISIPIFLYFSVGFSQFGYRYALDFLPFLFIILLYALNKKLTNFDIALITLGVIFNCIYITSLWNVYPLFGIK